MPTLFAKRPVVMYGKWKGEAEGTIEITGTKGNGDAYRQVIEVAGAQPQENNSALPYLWARARVEQLMDYGTLQEENSMERVKKEVTQIGLDYSMLTPYTSFIAVTEQVRNTGNEANDVNQPLPLPLHVSNNAVGSYTSGSEPGIAAVIVIGVFTLMIRGARRLRKRAS